MTTTRASAAPQSHTIEGNILNGVKTQLKYQFIDSSTMVFARFRSLLPQLRSSLGQVQIYQRLSVQPMAVSNADLARIFKLELCNENRLYKPSSDLLRKPIYILRSLEDFRCRRGDRVSRFHER